MSSHIHTQEIDLRVLLAFRQTNCLSEDNRASEVKVRSRPEIHLYKKRKKKRGDAEKKTQSGRARREKERERGWHLARDRREWDREGAC